MDALDQVPEDEAADEHDDVGIHSLLSGTPEHFDEDFAIFIRQTLVRANIDS